MHLYLNPLLTVLFVIEFILSPLTKLNERIIFSEGFTQKN